ncbi:MAG TPA: GNAT family N-acetyltransferase [Candidatus Obscuribacterales bacterium]
MPGSIINLKTATRWDGDLTREAGTARLFHIPLQFSVTEKGLPLKMEIRVLTPCDAGIYLPLRLRALKEEPASFAESYEEAQHRSAASIADRLGNGTDSFVLGLFDKELIGTVGFYRKQGMKVRHLGVIWGMYLAPEYRGRGLGKNLLMAALQKANTIEGLEQISLTVVTTNEAARQMYANAGFKVYGIEPRALKVNGEYYAEEHMFFDLRR